MLTPFLTKGNLFMFDMITKDKLTEALGVVNCSDAIAGYVRGKRNSRLCKR